MQFFLDTANIQEIEPWLAFIDGVTTNPSLVAKLRRPFHQVIRELCQLVQGPVSAEVTDLSNFQNMYKEARILADISEHVVVKVPLTPLGLKVGQKLVHEGIRINVTLCFSAAQALLAAKIGATYISPFIGRLDDHGADGLQLISDICTLYAAQPTFETQVLAASTRTPHHVAMAAQMGAQAATIPPALMSALFKHPLTDKGLEQFANDWMQASTELV